MQRRVLLQWAGTIVSTGALAGCLEDSAADGDPGSSTDGESADGAGAEDGETDPDDEHDDTGAAAGDGGDETPSVAAASITTLERDCTDGEIGTASVEFAEGSVELTGSLQASDPCHDAVLATALEDGDLRATVGLEADDADAVCQQCLARVAYEATVEFDGGLPDAVAVVHDDSGGRTDVTAETRE